VSEAAYVVGDVTIGDGSSVWPGAVIRGDFAAITIGANTHVEDNVVIHCGEDMAIGDNVTIGHGVVVHCRRVGNNCLLGNNSTILDRAEIGDACIVGAGALVLGDTVVPDGSFVVGVPATVRPGRPDQVARMGRRARSEGGYASMLKLYKSEGL
jgi:carbonic anhydrase/acetyltransferase-like protein (isoleucine patch superfamily)